MAAPSAPPYQESQPLVHHPLQQPPSYSQSTQEVPQHHETVMVVTEQPVTAAQIHFEDSPVTFTDIDGNQVTTVIEYRSGMLTWLIFALICFLTGCICFAVIPFCVDATKDVVHINPWNGAIVGVYRRIC